MIESMLLQTFPVAIVVPDPDVIPEWARKGGLPTTMHEFCENNVAKPRDLERHTQNG